ncbi:hypothetical protein BJY04DRAFT_217138 [Aspergillus karnatakaensis]|uniref:uncharacterized protein n=1 Tax=Aspergillus karnatakaensis TaxID=1810916 RepID=UPI003CCDBC74
MTDPFSVAASVAGVLSLGIEVCKGIIKYTDAWRGSDAEIANVTLKAEQLSNTLRQLEKVLNDAGSLDSAVVHNIRGIILANNNHIVKLREQILKCEAVPGPAADMKDKVRVVIKRAKYPFVRDSLLRMKDVLGELQVNLHTALHVAQLRQSTTLSKQMIFLEDMQLMMLTKLEHKSMIEEMAFTIGPQPSDYIQKSEAHKCADESPTA